METMILVVVLAVAALAGIAAAFYFSIRSGRRGDNHNSRARAARGLGRLRPGGSTADTGPERPGIGSRAANGGRAVNARRANQAADNFPDDAGANSTMDFGVLAVPDVRRAATSRQTGDEADDDAGAAPAAFEADADDASRTTRTRRRVGFRKGAEVDEELWPTESFGGVSDEQFWDDLASDKPLTTTARTAQQDSARRSGHAAQRIEPRGRDQTPRLPAAPDRPAAGRRASVTLAADAGADAGAVSPAETPDHRPLVQPAYGATQPVTPLKPAASARSATSQPAATPLKPVGGTGPLPASGRQPGTVAQPGEGRRPTISGGNDDPLTSSAFSLREAGPVDGHSLRTAGPGRGGDYQPSMAEEGQAPAPGDMGSGGYLPSPPASAYLAGYGAAPYGTSSYSPAPYDAAPNDTAPYGAGPYDAAHYGTAHYGTAHYDAAQYDAAQYGSAQSGAGPHDGPGRTPPNADTYGYRSPGPLDEPRRPNGPRPNGALPNGAPPNAARPNARHAGPDDRGRSAGSPSPQQQPGGGRHQSGGYQANGYPAAGRHGGDRRPYDPRDDYRRLTPPALVSGRGTGGPRGLGGGRGTGAGR
jgi:hypothetical protein